MKKFLLAVSALLVIGQNAQATSVKSALAQFTTGPLSHKRTLVHEKKKQVVIYADGQVYGYACNGKKPCPAFKLEQLSPKEVKAVAALVASARKGELKNGPPALCLAMPNTLFRYTADNDSVVLKTGTAPCGSTSEIERAAARTLVKELDAYMAELNRKVGSEE